MPAVFVIALFLMVSPAWAEESLRESIEQALESSEAGKVIVMPDPYIDKYQKPSVQNLSKLYWKLDAFKDITNEMVDNYLLINECDLYKAYYHNDFEWQQVRSITQEDLLKKKDSFSEKYKLIFSIELGRYDHERKGFHLVNGTALRNFHKLEVSANRLSDQICGRDGLIPYYPRNIALALSKPVNLNFVPVDPETAKGFLKRRQAIIGGNTREVHRPGYLRLRISFLRYQGVTKGKEFNDLAVIYGVLDGVDLFEYEDERNMLGSINLN